VITALLVIVSRNMLYRRGKLMIDSL